MVKRDVHRYDLRINAALRNIETNGFHRGNKDDLQEFYEHMVAEGLSKGRISKYLYHLIKIEKWLGKSFKEATKKDIIKLIQTIEGQDYTANTRHDYKITIKKFFRWLSNSEEYPEEVKWIKSTVKRNDSKIPEELLTIDEIKKMVETAEHPRNKAIASAIYESGCRPTEFLSFKIKHIVFDKYGAQLTISEGKTGMRKIRLLSSVPHLAAWIEMHPMRDNPDSLVWIAIGTRNRNKPILYRNLRQCIARIANKAGIRKKVYPYLFRHTAATHLANHLTEAQMCQYFGWVQGSKMPRVYVHLSGKDLDEPILRMHGVIKEEEKKKEHFSPKKCLRCDKVNPPTGKFCLKCGAPLDLETTLRVEKGRKIVDNVMESLLRDLLKNQKIRSIIEEKAEIMNIEI
jgi:site-specific recombinase XerD